MERYISFDVQLDDYGREIKAAIQVHTVYTDDLGNTSETRGCVQPWEIRNVPEGELLESGGPPTFIFKDKKELQSLLKCFVEVAYREYGILPDGFKHEMQLLENNTKELVELHEKIVELINSLPIEYMEQAAKYFAEKI